MDGTPIYDIKPYVAYADSRPEARSGFVDQHAWSPLEVIFDVPSPFSIEDTAILCDILSQDPRPAYHDDPSKVYGMLWSGYDIRFRVADGILTVTEIRPA